MKNLEIQFYDGDGNKIEKEIEKISKKDFKKFYDKDYFEIGKVKDKKIYQQDYNFMKIFIDEKDKIKKINYTKKYKIDIEQLKNDTYLYSDSKGNKIDLLMDITDDYKSDAGYFISIIKEWIKLNKLKTESITIGFKTTNDDLNTLSAYYSPYIENHKDTLIHWINDLKEKIEECVLNGTSSNDTDFRALFFHVISRL